MSENSERSKLSVRTKQRARRQPNSDKDEHDSKSYQFKVESAGNELQTPLSKNRYELIADSSSEKQDEDLNKTISNDDEENIIFSDDYVTPAVEALRRGLFRPMTCIWCLELFNAERDPRVTHIGMTRCSECLAEFYDTTTTAVKLRYPLNKMLIHSIRRAMKELRLFTSNTHAYSELERSIFKKNNTCNWPDIKNLRNQFMRLAMFVDDCNRHINKCFGKQGKAVGALAKTISAVENCREIRQLQDLSNHSMILSCYSKLKSLRALKILKQDEIEWIRWTRLFEMEDPTTSLSSKSALTVLQRAGTQWFCLYDRGGQRWYAELKADIDTTCISSFTTTFPKLSTLTVLPEFFRLDHDFVLESCQKVYFEICRVSIKGHCIESNKFYINIYNPLWPNSVVYRFLGNRESCYLGAEIEVTDDFIIFDYFLQNGKIVEEEDLPILSPKDKYQRMTIKRGMVVSQIRGQSKKLTLFKFDSDDLIVSFFGCVDAIMTEALITIPLGRHRITACGIGLCLSSEKI